MKTLNKTQWVGIVAGLAVVGIFVFGGNLFNAFRSINSNDTTFQSPENITMSEPGFIIQEIVQGTGAEAEVGDLITVHYVGTLTDGTVFDSSLARQDPFQFILGIGQVIEGWDKGVLGMKEGSRRRLVIPPAMGYGENPIGPIPANSTLIFEVELIKVEKPQ